MALVTRTMSGLVNGVSRQPWALHLDSQGYEQINCMSSTARGVVRRPGSSHLCTIPVPGGSTISLYDSYHWIDRDTTHRYLVNIGKRSSTGYITVTDLIAATGTAMTVKVSPAAQTWLNLQTAVTGDTGAPKDLQYLTVGDSTFITSRKMVPAMAATTSTALTYFGAIWVKSAVIKTEYKVSITPSGGTAVDYTGFAASDTVATTEAITAGYVTALNATVHGSHTLYASAVGKNLVAVWACLTAGLAPVAFTMEATDSWGNNAVASFVNGATVQNFSELPPMGLNGLKVQVKGDPDTDQGVYYVEFTADQGTLSATNAGPNPDQTATGGRGVWNEIVKWGTVTTVNPTTMPLVLHFDSVNWYLNTLDGLQCTAAGNTWATASPADAAGTYWTSPVWGSRTCGDTTTAPNPSFIGYSIQDLTFFSNRLCVVSGESVSCSGVDDLYNFFPTTTITTADDDAVDITANFPQVAKFRYALPFNAMLILFAESGIYTLSRGAADAFTHKSAQMARVTNFAGKPSTRPRISGDRIFFTEKVSNVTYLREFFQVTAETYTVESASEHVRGYIDDPEINCIAANGVKNIVALLPSTFSPTMYVYQYFFSNREKVQSAWHKWTFAGKTVNPGLSLSIFSGAFVGNTLYYVTYEFALGGVTTYSIKSLDIDPTANSNLVNDDLLPFFDNWQVVATGTYSAPNTTYTVKGLWPYLRTEFADVVCMQYGSDWASNVRGVIVTPISCTADVATGTTAVVVSGDSSAKDMLFGLRYRSSYEFSMPVMKDPKGGPMLAGRYNIRRFRPHFENAVDTYGYYDVLPKPYFDDTTLTRSQLYTAKSTYEVPVGRQPSSTMTLGVYSEEPTQDFALFGVTWEFEYTPRGGRGV